MGDHPPITPSRSATEAEVGGGDAWRLYDYIARHFLASLSPDCITRRANATFTVGGETFAASGGTPVKAGFTAIMPWKVRACLSCMSAPFARILPAWGCYTPLQREASSC